jgi:uncharacterized protein YbjT (DUF2867 family)
MPQRVFITGATGYIGGHTTDILIKAHPEFQIVTLVRNEKQAAALVDKWPGTTTVIGTLDDDKILQEAAAKADVVLRM